MPTTTYRLRQNKIQLDFNYGKGKRFRYSTGLAIQKEKNWDSDKMRIRNVVEEKHKTEVNNQLNNLLNKLEGKYSQLAVQDNVVVTNEMLKEFCDIFFNKHTPIKEDEKSIELLEYYEWYISNYSTKPLPTTGTPLGKGTTKTYRNSFNILKRFNDNVYPLYFGTITLSFYDDFLEWLYVQDYSSNYVGTQIKVLKTILQSATEKDYNTNNDFTKKYFRKPIENIDNIYLSLNEISRISKLDLSNFKPVVVNKTLTITKVMMEKARDLFLIGCCTGLRVSDFNKLNNKNIYKDDNGKDYLSLITQKNNKPITIPLNSTAQNILMKNNGNTPTRLPEQHINYCIKILGDLADINELTQKTTTKGGIPITSTLPKNKLITNHTARRSFCTNAYLSGMPTSDIMALSGHATEKVFYNYIKVNDLQKAIKIGKHKFFD